MIQQTSVYSFSRSSAPISAMRFQDGARLRFAVASDPYPAQRQTEWADGGAPNAGSATPIQHLVVVFQENISFDHYFGTYPNAANPKGEPAFHAKAGTPTINGYNPALLNHNPNLNPMNGIGATNPFRLDRSQAVTSDQDHDYDAEQKAFNKGALDLFPLYVGTPGPPPSGGGITSTTGLNMGYYDGNTVTALWNHAQNFAMSDNSYSTTFGPSTPGMLNLISGQTNGVASTQNGTGDEVDGGNGSLTVVGDPCVVPVLRVHGQSQAHQAVIDCRNRARRSGQPRV